MSENESSRDHAPLTGAALDWSEQTQQANQFAAAKAAYDHWRRAPSSDNREALRRAILSSGGQIVGHGVIGWAKANLQPTTPSSAKPADGD